MSEINNVSGAKGADFSDNTLKSDKKESKPDVTSERNDKEVCQKGLGESLKAAYLAKIPTQNIESEGDLPVEADDVDLKHLDTDIADDSLVDDDFTDDDFLDDDFAMENPNPNIDDDLVDDDDIADDDFGSGAKSAEFDLPGGIGTDTIPEITSDQVLDASVKYGMESRRHCRENDIDIVMQSKDDRIRLMHMGLDDAYFALKELDRSPRETVKACLGLVAALGNKANVNDPYLNARLNVITNAGLLEEGLVMPDKIKDNASPELKEAMNSDLSKDDALKVFDSIKDNSLEQLGFDYMTLSFEDNSFSKSNRQQFISETKELLRDEILSRLEPPKGKEEEATDLSLKDDNDFDADDDYVDDDDNIPVA